MTTRIDQIAATDWSPRVGIPGEVVTDTGDIDQCIGIILATRKGSDPHRPLFGCDAWRWLDAPVAVAIPNIVREVVDALDMWEPRIKVVRVLVSFTAAGQVTVNVEWQLATNRTITRNTEVQFANAA